MVQIKFYFKNEFLCILFRLDCFYALTDGGKKMNIVDDRLRGIFISNIKFIKDFFI